MSFIKIVHIKTVKSVHIIVDIYMTFDKPINRNESDTTVGSFMRSETKTPEEHLICKENIQKYKFNIENPSLYNALTKLNKKQIQILYLYYVKGYNNKNIAEYFGQTEQNISYWHKKTLKQLKSIINENTKRSEQ
ncbi:hypothetical protein BLX87_11120 [Bacillus sp. VT-16-64]|nr:hypothetical protein BLX87_11120 [Bacillus sp. VT-16-64]